MGNKVVDPEFLQKMEKAYTEMCRAEEDYCEACRRFEEAEHLFHQLLGESGMKYPDIDSEF